MLLLNCINYLIFGKFQGFPETPRSLNGLLLSDGAILVQGHVGILLLDERPVVIRGVLVIHG